MVPNFPTCVAVGRAVSSNPCAVGVAHRAKVEQESSELVVCGCLVDFPDGVGRLPGLKL